MKRHEAIVGMVLLLFGMVTIILAFEDAHRHLPDGRDRIVSPLPGNGFKEVTRSSTSDVGAVMYLIALSAIFSYGLIWDRIPEVIANLLLAISAYSYISSSCKKDRF